MNRKHVPGCSERKHLPPPALTTFPKSGDWVFQQDDAAPCHTAKSGEMWMEEHKTLSWPGETPDLNPSLKTSGMWIERKTDESRRMKSVIKKKNVKALAPNSDFLTLPTLYVQSFKT